VTDKILEKGLVNHCDKRVTQQPRMIVNLFMKRVSVMTDAEIIEKVKKSLLNPESVYDDVTDFGMMDQMNEF
jgi:hypothetical protein